MNYPKSGRVPLLALAVLVLPALSSPKQFDPESLRKTYFGSGWAKADGDGPALTKSAAKPAPEDPDLPGATHAKVAHMYITVKAFEMYNAQFPGSELSRYIGQYSDASPRAGPDDNVVKGSFDEDEPHENPWDDVMPFNRHFWRFRGGYYQGLATFDSSVNRAHKYFSGGYGIEKSYDPLWSGNLGRKRGVEGQGIVYLYRHGDKAKAYWFLGHAAHLLEDLTVPAHAHLYPHVVDRMDRYESYIKVNHARWDKVPADPIESFETLYDIFLKTGEVTDHFDCGSDSGVGIDGSLDRGRRRAGGFTPKELDEEADVLMPLAVKRVAALYKFFYKQVDHDAPKVTLNAPASGDMIRPDHAASGPAALAASALDAVSGVDREGYHFEYRLLTAEGWSPWAAAGPQAGASNSRFHARHDGLYAFRVSARDAAGNVGVSAIKYLRVGGDARLLVHR